MTAATHTIEVPFQVVKALLQRSRYSETGGMGTYRCHWCWQHDGNSHIATCPIYQLRALVGMRDAARVDGFYPA